MNCPNCDSPDRIFRLNLAFDDPTSMCPDVWHNKWTDADYDKWEFLNNLLNEIS